MRRKCHSCLCRTCLITCCDRKECSGKKTECERYSGFRQLSIFEPPEPKYQKIPRHSWDYYGITSKRHRELTEAIRSGKHQGAAWSAAVQADEKIARHILKSVLEGKGYDKIEFDLELGRICVCRTDFYGIRRYFYHLFDQELKNRIRRDTEW